MWSKVHGPFPARGDETKCSAFKAVRNNTDCFHVLTSVAFLHSLKQLLHGIHRRMRKTVYLDILGVRSYHA